MEIILLEKIKNLGTLGDTVKVRSGFARNFLIPKGKATEATPANRAKFEARRAELELAANDALVRAKARAEKLDGMVVTMSVKAGSEGRLFGSVSASDIADAVSSANIELTRTEIRMPQGPIRQTGQYEIVLNLHSDVTAKLHVHVDEA